MVQPPQFCPSKRGTEIGSIFTQSLHWHAPQPHNTVVAKKCRRPPVSLWCASESGCLIWCCIASHSSGVDEKMQFAKNAFYVIVVCTDFAGAVP